MAAAPVPERFSREQGCSAAEWERDLPGAAGSHPLESPAPGQALVRLAGGGCLHLRWQALPPRQIALIRLPRLQVDFRFDGVAADDRAAFLRYFDLFLHRGGG